MAQINKSTDYFDISTWTATTSAISNLGFSPDWVWIKSTDSANGHILFDTIRGANERLSSASSAAESTRTDELMSFDSNGYTLGSSGNTNDTNPFNASYVGWSWRGSDSSAVSNTDGSITSTVSANTTSGFSIVSYTGTGANATVGHGLGVAPSWIVIKGRNQTEDWTTYHISTGNTKNVILNSTAVPDTSTTYWQDTSPTSSVFYLGSSTRPNTSGGTYIAYCFAEKKGFSKFGSYTGNGNSDGTFIYTGFKPAFVIMKRTDTTGNWLLFDNNRSSSGGSNLIQQYLYPNLNDAEDSDATRGIDFLSNGFKQRNDFSAINASGGSYIYMAFAEQPLVGTNNIPATAR
jgi:hypothetical protein